MAWKGHAAEVEKEEEKVEFNVKIKLAIVRKM